MTTIRFMNYLSVRFIWLFFFTLSGKFKKITLINLIDYINLCFQIIAGILPFTLRDPYTHELVFNNCFRFFGNYMNKDWNWKFNLIKIRKKKSLRVRVYIKHILAPSFASYYSSNYLHSTPFLSFGKAMCTVCHSKYIVHFIYVISSAVSITCCMCPEVYNACNVKGCILCINQNICTFKDLNPNIRSIMKLLYKLCNTFL